MTELATPAGGPHNPHNDELLDETTITRRDIQRIREMKRRERAGRTTATPRSDEHPWVPDATLIHGPVPGPPESLNLSIAGDENHTGHESYDSLLNQYGKPAPRPQPQPPAKRRAVLGSLPFVPSHGRLELQDTQWSTGTSIPLVQDTIRLVSSYQPPETQAEKRAQRRAKNDASVVRAALNDRDVRPPIHTEPTAEPETPQSFQTAAPTTGSPNRPTRSSIREVNRLQGSSPTPTEQPETPTAVFPTYEFIEQQRAAEQDPTVEAAPLPRKTGTTAQTPQEPQSSAVVPPSTKKRSRRRAFTSVIAVVLALVLAGTVVAFSTGFGASYSPEAIAREYLSALTQGNGAKAVELSMQNLEAGTEFLPDRAYAVADERLTGLNIAKVEQDGDRAVVTVSGQQKDELFETEIVLTKQSKRDDLIFPQWRVTTGLERPIKVSLPQGMGAATAQDIAVNGTELDVKNAPSKEEITLLAFPGAYTVQPPQVDDYFSYGDEQSVFIGVADKKPATLTFNERPSKKLFKEASTLANSFVQQCMTQLGAADCPNAAIDLPIATAQVDNFTWHLKNHKYTLRDGGKTLELKGTFELTYTYDAQEPVYSWFPDGPKHTVTRTERLSEKTKKDWAISINVARDGLTLS
ncbi:hypothetical protein [Timonella sp. A28]|uniref:hypothetical protein n=1 Tax=Timonella sp. A28 TaxID=3442640 RepID=UPI003EBAE058